MDRQSQVMLWCLVAAATINSKGSVQAATSNADKLVDAFKVRFADKDKPEDD